MTDRNDSSELEVLREISAKLDLVLKAVALGIDGQDNQIRALKSCGFSWPEIGELVGLKADAARKRLSTQNSEHA